MSVSRRQQRQGEGKVAPVLPDLSVLWPSPTGPACGVRCRACLKAHRGRQAPGTLNLPAGTLRPSEAVGLLAGSHPHGVISISSFSLIYFVKYGEIHIKLTI